MTQFTFKSLFIMISFLLIGLNAHSQTEEMKAKEKAIYDSITFHYYNEKVWDSVIDIAKEALYRGHDFYYLRMRLGLAYEYQGNFRYAEKQYKEALKHVPTDVNAAYYNYFAAINGGRKRVAYADFKNYSFDQVKSIKKDDNPKMKYLYENHLNTTVHNIRTKAIDRIYFAYGYSFTGNSSKLADIYPQHKGISYSVGNVRENQTFFNFSVGGNISPMVEWDLSFNNSKITAVKLLQQRDSSHQEIPISVLQNELFLGARLYSGNGWNMKMTGHVLHYNSNFITIYDTMFYEVPESAEDTMLVEESLFGITDFIIKKNDYVVGLSINKKIGLVDFSIFGSYASILDKNPIQIGGELTILPRGNYSLYLTNRLFYYTDESSQRFVYKVSAGALLTKKINFDASVTFGDLQFTNEPGVAVVYNWSEKTTFKGDLVFSYKIAEKVYLSLRYQLTQKQSKYNYYTIDETLPSDTHSGYYYNTYKEKEDFYKFNQHFVILGLSWKF